MRRQNFNSLSEPAETSSSFIMFSIRNSTSEAFPQHSPHILRTFAMKRFFLLLCRLVSASVLCGCLGPVAAQLRDLSGQRTSLKHRIRPKWVDVSQNYIMDHSRRGACQVFFTNGCLHFEGIRRWPITPQCQATELKMQMLEGTSFIFQRSNKVSNPQNYSKLFFAHEKWRSFHLFTTETQWKKLLGEPGAFWRIFPWGLRGGTDRTTDTWK